MTKNICTDTVQAKVLTMGGPNKVTTSEGESVSLEKYKQVVAVAKELENQRKLAQIAGLNPGFGPRKSASTDPTGMLAELTHDDSDA